MEIKLREIRRAKDITQEELSKMSGVGRSTIINLERGTRTEITLSTLVKLANALEVDLSDLIFLGN